MPNNLRKAVIADVGSNNRRLEFGVREVGILEIGFDVQITPDVTHKVTMGIPIGTLADVLRWLGLELPDAR